VQPLEMLLYQATWSGVLGSCLGKLSEGQMFVGEQRLSLVPLPFESSEPVKLDLMFQNGESLTAFASRAAIRFTGEPRFVESFGC
jgi:hypothetical protein